MRRKRKVVKIKDKRAELAIKGGSLEEIFQKITIKRAPRKARREKEVLADLGIGKKQSGANFQTFIPDRQVPIYSPYRNNYYVPKPQDYNVISGALTDKSKDVKGEVEKQLNELLGKYQSGLLSLPYINNKGLPQTGNSSSSGVIGDEVIATVLYDEEEAEKLISQGMEKQANEAKKKRSESAKKAVETKKKKAEKKQEEEKKKQEEEKKSSSEEEIIMAKSVPEIKINEEYPQVDVEDVLRFRFKPSTIDYKVERAFIQWYNKYQKQQFEDNGEYETDAGTIETEFIRDKILGNQALKDKYLRYKKGGVIA